MNQKKFTFLIALFSFILLNTLICFNIFKNKYISSDILRLHVIANSNSIEDQIIKLKAECKINKYISSLNSNSKEELIKDISNNKDTILNIANSTIKENNQDYSSLLKIGKISYDKKQNMMFDMDRGTYDSASIVLGKGDGKNIWSIIFPNDKTIDKIKELDTIIPGISQLYESKEDNDENDKVTEIKSKLFPSFKLSLE